MSEQSKRPAIRGKVTELMEEWRNDAGTFWKREVVIETGLRYPNPIKVTFQKDAVSHLEGVEVGDCVIVPYLLNGREYNGRIYVDVVGMGLEKVGSAKKGEKKPILGCTAQTAIETWAKYHGEDKAAFADFCKQQKPGKSSKDYTVGDWADIVNAIEAAQKPQPQTETADAGDCEDLPF